MLDPCLNCVRCARDSGRKADCLSPYPRLRAIGNSSGGFKAYSGDISDWSAVEIMLYNNQLRANQPNRVRIKPLI